MNKWLILSICLFQLEIKYLHSFLDRSIWGNEICRHHWSKIIFTIVIPVLQWEFAIGFPPGFLLHVNGIQVERWSFAISRFKQIEEKLANNSALDCPLSPWQQNNLPCFPAPSTGWLGYLILQFWPGTLFRSWSVNTLIVKLYSNEIGGTPIMGSACSLWVKMF